MDSAVTSSVTVEGTISTWLKSPPSASTQRWITPCSIGISQVAYVWPAILAGLVMPLSFMLMMPEVLCWMMAATAVTGSAASPETYAAMVSWKVTPNWASPAATSGSAPFSGAWRISTSRPASL